MDLTPLKEFALHLARESARVILPHFGNPSLEVEQKSDNTPVTVADRDAEIVMRNLIRQAHPDHGIFGEEFGLENEEAPLRWVLDPIDGTKSFVAGTPQFGTLIALMEGSQPLLGVIASPVTGQVLLGDNEQTTLNGQPVRVRDCANLAEATLLTTDLANPSRYQSPTGWRRLCDAVAKLYTWGDCHGYHLVATGGAEIMCDPIMSPWDQYALIPVIRGAGGTITDWHGGDPVSGNSIVAASPALHAQVIQFLREK